MGEARRRRQAGATTPRPRELTPEEQFDWLCLIALRKSEHWPKALRGARAIVKAYEEGRPVPVPPIGHDTPEAQAEWLQWNRIILFLAGEAH